MSIAKRYKDVKGNYKNIHYLQVIQSSAWNNQPRINRQITTNMDSPRCWTQEQHIKSTSRSEKQWARLHAQRHGGHKHTARVDENQHEMCSTVAFMPRIN